MSALPSSRKTHSERHKQILKQLLKEPANKLCVDCKTATHPRWASWNLGCFICIRCSGIHRLMGTHISRVKSVDLDAWTDEQVELMVKWGNAKCNAYWEAKLPDQYVPDGLKIENFIRTKYDLKKWVASVQVPEPSSIKTGSDAAALNVSVSASNTGSTARSTVSAPPATTNSHATIAKKVSSHSSRSSAPLSLLDDEFGMFTSSPLPTPTPAHQISSHRTQGAHSAIQNAGDAPSHISNERKNLKKSILSLYSLPSSSLSSFVNNGQAHSYGKGAGNTYGAPKTSAYGHANVANSNATSSTGEVPFMTDSLMGLSFGGLKKPVAQQATQQAVINPELQSKASSLWKNDWNDSSSSVNNWASSVGNSSSSIGSPLNGTPCNSWQGSNTANYTTSGASGTSNRTTLDDDLFKNVWS